MRYDGGLRYAVLGVVSRNQHGVHGWVLKTQCERMLGEFWQLNFGEVYRVLDSLCAESLIEQIVPEVGSNRKVYRITQKGRRSLDDFILTAPTDVPRPLRQELAVKLLFAAAEQLGDLLQLIDCQRKTYMEELIRLTIQRRRLRRLPVDSFVTNLLIDHAELTSRAEIAWLDVVTAALKERFGNGG